MDKVAPPVDFTCLHSPGELGAWLAARRRSLGYDQGTTARLAGVSRLWLSEMERGKIRASIGHVFRVLVALRADIAVGPASVAPPSRTAPRSDPDEPSILDRIIERARETP